MILWGVFLGTLLRIFKKVSPKSFVPLLIVGILLGAVYFDIAFFRIEHNENGEVYLTSGWMWERAWRRASYYSHSPLVILVVAYLINKKKTLLEKIPPRRCSAGLWVIGMALAIRVIASFPQIWFLSGFSLPMAIWGVILYFWGKRAAKELFWPIAFLFLMIPLPLKYIDTAAVTMRNSATSHTAWILERIGMTILREKSLIHMYSGGGVETIKVGDVCSGLRSLIALLAFGAFFAYLVKRSVASKLALLASSIPIAYVANIARILALTFIAWGFGASAAAPGNFKAVSDAASFFDYLWHQIVHYGTGMVLFIVAFFALLGVNRLLELAERRFGWKPAEPKPLDGATEQASIFPLGQSVKVATALVFSGILVLAFTIGGPPPPRSDQAREIPLEVGLWRGIESPIDEATKEILETDDIIIRKYSSDSDDSDVVLAVVYSKSDRKVAHPPPICYTGAGWLVEEEVAVPLELNGVEHEVMRVSIEKYNKRHLVLYWYKCGDDYVGSHEWAQLKQIIVKLKARLGQFFGKDLANSSSIALIRISTTIEKGNDEAAEKLLRDFARYLEPQLREHLP